MKYKDSSCEDELIKGCKRNNRTAQKYLYKKYFSPMLNICMRYARDRDEACEILNDAFLKVFKQLQKNVDIQNPGAWIRKIVLYTAIDFSRKNAKYRSVVDFNTTHETNVDNQALENLENEEVLHLIQQLPPASRSVFSLYVFEGYPHKEIAELLNISIGTSKWHLANAKEKLKVLIENQSILHNILAS